MPTRLTSAHARKGARTHTHTHTHTHGNAVIRHGIWHLRTCREGGGGEDAPGAGEMGRSDARGCGGQTKKRKSLRQPRRLCALREGAEGKHTVGDALCKPGCAWDTLCGLRCTWNALCGLRCTWDALCGLRATVSWTSPSSAACEQSVLPA
eukprot:scaffold12551_cov21-Tisochrysis_lutea.AAC.3